MRRTERRYRVWIDRPSADTEIPADVDLNDGPSGAEAVIVGSGEFWDGTAAGDYPI